VCYPLLYTSFEREYLAILGLNDAHVLDTRSKVEVVARSIVISNNQSLSRLPSPTGIDALRRLFLDNRKHGHSAGRRLYLSREGWKRQVRNEAEVRRLMSSYGFEIVESMPTSVKVQIQMFSDASVIVSPHGSALTNLLWCAPGTRVVELFSRSFMPPMYAYISHILGLRYAYIVDSASEQHHWTNMHKDMDVNMNSLSAAVEMTDLRR
jgi:capsular polysaccharide biosynthesis protein